jgi:hypothetical protein
MIVVSDDETWLFKQNHDDQLGERVDIPTVIFKKNFGSNITDYMKKNPDQRVIISVHFTGIKKDKLEIDFYLRSDDVKALHMFTEFREVFEKLGIVLLLNNKI